MRVLFINQTYYPDCTATGQYLADLSVALAKRGHAVFVLCARRAYLDHHKIHPRNEVYEGVSIQRIWSPPFQRAIRLFRVIEALYLILAFGFALLFHRKIDRVVALTTPPLLAWMCVLICRIRGFPLAHWAMDINPQQSIRTGWIKDHSLITRCLLRMNSYFLSRIPKTIVLDPYMKSTVQDCGVSPERLVVCPLWYDKENISPVARAQNPFRQKHSLDDKFVIMYSGNHSICHPLDTVLQASLHFREDSSTYFVFIGGGARVAEVKRFSDRHSLTQTLQLPYQSREDLKFSLSSADIQIISMGEAYVGLVHPSKIYGLLAVGRPIIYIGPERSPIADLLTGLELAFQVTHGDLVAMVKAVESIRKAPASQIERNLDQMTTLAKSYEKSEAVIRLEEVLTNDTN